MQLRLINSTAGIFAISVFRILVFIAASLNLISLVHSSETSLVNFSTSDYVVMNRSSLPIIIMTRGMRNAGRKKTPLEASRSIEAEME